MPLSKQLPAADQRSHVQKLRDAELHNTIHDGRANMPVFGEIDQWRDQPGAEARAEIRRGRDRKKAIACPHLVVDLANIPTALRCIQYIAY